MDHSHLHNQILLLSIALVLFSFHASSLPLVNTTSDRKALLAFKSILSDPTGALASWSNNGSLHLCGWRGVTCSRRRHRPRVVALDLESLSLTGTISPSISNLTFLRSLHIPNNHLTGLIPSELGRLFRLSYLNLSMNSLDGEIPLSLFPAALKLSVVDLSSNKLTGSIPPLPANSSSLYILFLSSNQLSGSIPTSLANISSLSYLNLSNNSLTGNIPAFSSLRTLDLSLNNLSGGIPPSLGNSSTLLYLDLAQNSLSGSIPPFLRIPSPLVVLGLSTNHLSGGIPSSLGNLSSLLYLYLADNNLEGDIPGNIANIPSLQELDLTINNLSGEIASPLYNLSSMSYLGVGDNKLFGALPPDIGFTLPNLQFLVMQGNNFHGNIPASLSNASGLQMLNLANNKFTGFIPSNLGSLSYLQELNVGWNRLQSHDWGFFSSLTNCSLLQKLCLQANELAGALPESVGNLSTQLNLLLIGENRISGSIPVEIGNLVSLTVLYIDHNLLTGNIPSTIGKLKNLHVLNMSSTRISGLIPSSIGNLTQLNELYMEKNRLSGAIPASFGTCKNLGALNLSHNALGGSIPKEIVSLFSLAQFLDLSHNSLTGSLPVEVGRLINLGHLDVSKNQLSGEIPPTLSDCQLLEYLDIGDNFLQGNIPRSFINLKGIKVLDLSSNNLSGQIPEFLAAIRNLQQLNLSFNNFEGEVPKRGIFRNASAISVLGNQRLCSDDPTLQLPSCFIKSSETSKILHVLTIIIPTVSGVVVLLLLFFGIRCHRGKAVENERDIFSLNDKYRKVSYSDILKATQDFSSANLVGSGSYGSVYKGNLDFEGSAVAVKVFNLHQKGALKSFMAECEVLRNIRHRNLVKILTLCSSVDSTGKDFKALVFEFMPNESLENWLHPEACIQRQPRKLNLIQRLNIAIDVASALDYLHHSCVPAIVHCDLKPSNVLLDNDMVAHVGDFGLARFLSTSGATRTENSTSLMGLKGSIGYVAPEYGTGSQISTQGDVYSYGVLLLEMLTGKRPSDDMFKDGLNLHKFVEAAFPERVVDILDPQILQQEVGNSSVNRTRIWRCILSLFRIGLLCSKEYPRERMEMRDVSLATHAINELLFS